MNLPSLELTFTKMHGTGNSFIIISDLAGIAGETLAANPETIIRVCSREHGLGADGLVLIQHSTHPQANFKLQIYNAGDGSTAEMCGNAVRCVSHYLFATKLQCEAACSLETPAGLIHCNRLTENALSATVKVTMGAPSFTSTAFTPPTKQTVTATPLQYFNFNEYAVFFVSMGNPHAVIPVVSLQTTELAGIAAMLQQKQELFPQGVNVGFLTWQNKTPTAAALRVIERGVGETRACGTGACAAAVVLNILQTLPPAARSAIPELPAAFKTLNPAGTPAPNTLPSLNMKLLGGELLIDWAGLSLPMQTSVLPAVFMTGPAELIATGNLTL